MNSHIGTALFIVTAVALGWLLKTQIDTNHQQMNEIRDLHAQLADNASRATFEQANKVQRPVASASEIFRLRSACADLGQRIQGALSQHRPNGNEGR